mgnify:CR=1 FL=1
MPETYLSPKFIENVKSTAKRQLFFDKKQRGLVLAVQPSGRKSFKLIYHLNGKTRWFTLGRTDELRLSTARQLVERKRAEITLGTDPAEERKQAREEARQQKLAPKAVTFGQVAKEYFSTAQKRAAKQYEGHYNRRLSHLANLPVAEVSRAHLQEVVNGLEDAGKFSTAKLAMASAQAIFKLAIKRGYITENPATGVVFGEAPKREEEAYRNYSGDELRRIWQSLEALQPEYAAMVTIAMYTGQRGESEIAQMRWEDVQGRWWTQPTNKTDVVHRVYLCDEARAALDRMEPKESGPVFSLNLHTSLYRKIERVSGVERFKMHSFRVTATTRMGALRIPDKDQSRVMNHSEGGVTAGYRRYAYDDEKAFALQKYAHHLNNVLNGDTADMPTDAEKVWPETQKGQVVEFPSAGIAK